MPAPVSRTQRARQPEWLHTSGFACALVAEKLAQPAPAARPCPSPTGASSGCGAARSQEGARLAAAARPRGGAPHIRRFSCARHSTGKDDWARNHLIQRQVEIDAGASALRAPRRVLAHTCRRPRRSRDGHAAADAFALDSHRRCAHSADSVPGARALPLVIHCKRAPRGRGVSRAAAGRTRGRGAVPADAFALDSRRRCAHSADSVPGARALPLVIHCKRAPRGRGVSRAAAGSTCRRSATPADAFALDLRRRRAHAAGTVSGARARRGVIHCKRAPRGQGVSSADRRPRPCCSAAPAEVFALDFSWGRARAAEPTPGARAPRHVQLQARARGRGRACAAAAFSRRASPPNSSRVCIGRPQAARPRC